MADEAGGPNLDSPLTFLKLGGSLITDKTHEAIPRSDVISRLAAEVKSALEARPTTQLLIGHGSGSYGHFAGRRFGTRKGVRSTEEWIGYAQVSAAAARLNRLVADAFLRAGVPVLGLQPSASAVCRDGVLQRMALEPIRRSLGIGLVPLLYGDVALDEVRGGTIISTEEIFAFLASKLGPDRILLVGKAAGVLDATGEVIPVIRPSNLDEVTAHLSGSHGVDVTGGMLSKVTSMVDLVSAHPQLSVRILTGLADGELQRALIDPDYPAGTLISP